MPLPRLLIVAGAALILIGLTWPLLSRLGLGKLPGDIVIHRGHFAFYFPIVTCFLISAAITLLFWLFHR